MNKLEKLKEYIPKHQNGAKLRTIELSKEENILPTGALHKELNHLDKELDITKKGIPVIQNVDDTVETLEEIKAQGGELQQSAEIENSEIIFNKELTDLIENKRKEWHKSEEKDDDILLEIGKRVCKEVIFNTKDETNLIDQIEGTL